MGCHVGGDAVIGVEQCDVDGGVCVYVCVKGCVLCVGL